MSHSPSKICTTCGIEKPLDDFHRRRHRSKDGRRTSCADCTNGINRDENRNRSEPEKARVRARTALAVEKGLLTKNPCEKCGLAEVEAHHLHYDQNDSHLAVMWLCIEHHRIEHGLHFWTRQTEFNF